MSNFISKETVNRLLKDVKHIIKNPLIDNGIYYIHDDIQLYRVLPEYNTTSNIAGDKKYDFIHEATPDADSMYEVFEEIPAAPPATAASESTRRILSLFGTLPSLSISPAS